ncbi:MAG: hypothetical protein FWD26_04550 [Treponema sp.]|nr:hypothetical protein [Treponema sp.]
MTNARIAPIKASKEAHKLIPEIWEGFYENFVAYEKGIMKLEDEAKYRILSSPGPSQYDAFVKFFNEYIKGKSQWVLENIDDMHMHDFMDIENYGGPAIIEFLQNLISNYDCQGKVITMVSGSFWRSRPDIREKIISLFKSMCEKKAKVRIITQAKVEESHLGEFSDFLRKNPENPESHFGMEKRAPIHFVRADNDYLYYEFPHTESTQFRLNMFLNLNTVPIKEGKEKKDLLRFLDDIIEGRL